jgi:hypothetical protein
MRYVIGFLVALVPFLVQAEPAPEPSAPSTEMANPIDQGSFRASGLSSFAFSRMSGPNYSMSELAFGIDVDYFFRDYFSAGPAFDLTWTSSGGVDTTLFLFGFAVGLSGYFREAYVPFMHVSPGFAIADVSGVGSATSFLFSVDGGMDFLVTEKIAFGVAVRYTRVFSNPALNLIGIPLRFTLYF